METGHRRALCQVRLSLPYTTLSALLTHCSALTWGYPSTFGVFQLYYTETLQIARAQVSWIGSIQLFIFLFLATFAGRLADAGFARHAVLAGTLLVLFGTFMTSLASTYYQILLAQGICTGIGMGIMFMPTISIVSSHFYKRRGLALALAASGNGTGSTILPATVQYLTPKVGFPWAVRCAGFIALLFGILANLLLKTRLAPRRSGPLLEWSIFREPAYVLLTCGCFFFYWAVYFCFFYVNSYARDVIGFSTASSIQLLLITNVAGMPGRPLVGWIADTYTGPLNAFIVCMAGVSCLLYGWTGVRDRTGMYAFSVLYGFFAGSAQGVYGAAVASLTKDPAKMGTRFGMVSTMMAFAVLAGPPTAGALIDVSGGKYTWAQVWGGSSMFLGTAMVAAARAWITGGRLFAKA